MMNCAVVCRPTELQLKLYDMVLQNKHAQRALNEDKSLAFRNIALLQKLCNHPKLVFDTEFAGGKTSRMFKPSDFPASFGKRVGRRVNSGEAAASTSAATSTSGGMKTEGVKKEASDDSVDLIIQAHDGRHVTVDTKGRLMLQGGSAGAAGTFTMQRYSSKTFGNRISLSNSTFQGVCQFARADTAIKRTLRLGKKRSTWESFLPQCVRAIIAASFS